jgi:phage-related protein
MAYKAALIAVAVYEAIVDALNPVGWIILAIAAIAAGAYLIYKNWGAVTRALSVAWDAIKSFFTGIWHWIQDVGAAIGNWFTVTLPNFFTSIPGKIWAALQALPGLLGNLFLGALHAAGEAIGIGIGLILALWIKVPQLIWEALQKIPGLVADLWHAAVSRGTEIVRAGIAAIVYIFTVLPGKIGGFMMRLPGIIGGAFRDAWNWAKREVSDGANAIVGFVQRLPGRISGFMRNVGHDILGGLRAGINSVIGGFNSGIDKVAGMIHIGLPHIPMLASGGLINAPTLAVVGEAGPEAVIPMSDPARAAAVAKQTGLLDILGSKMSNAGTTLVRVYLGTREITDILGTVVDKKLNDQANELAYGTR